MLNSQFIRKRKAFVILLLLTTLAYAGYFLIYPKVVRYRIAVSDFQMATTILKKEPQIDESPQTLAYFNKSQKRSSVLVDGIKVSLPFLSSTVDQVGKMTKDSYSPTIIREREPGNRSIFFYKQGHSLLHFSFDRSYNNLVDYKKEFSKELSPFEKVHQVLKMTRKDFVWSWNFMRMSSVYNLLSIKQSFNSVRLFKSNPFDVIQLGDPKLCEKDLIVNRCNLAVLIFKNGKEYRALDFMKWNKFFTQDDINLVVSSYLNET